MKKKKIMGIMIFCIALFFYFFGTRDLCEMITASCQLKYDEEVEENKELISVTLWNDTSTEEIKFQKINAENIESIKQQSEQMKIYSNLEEIIVENNYYQRIEQADETQMWFYDYPNQHLYILVNDKKQI